MSDMPATVSEPAPTGDLRILEIGPNTEITSAFPDQTQLFWTYYKSPPRDASPAAFSLRKAWRIWRDAKAGRIDLIVAWCSPYSPFNFRELKAVIQLPLRPLSNLVRIIGLQWLRLAPPAIPIVAIDMGDSRLIARHNLFLLDRATVFFKRELPVDRWQAFQRTAHAGLPGPRFRLKSRNQARVEKLRPISLGVPRRATALSLSDFPPKTTDIFVALMLQGGTTVRDQGIAQLRVLANSGIVVDIAEQRLDYPEYMRRMCQAWLTWSPEGLGWDCFRHYEAPLAWSIPVMNSPTITRHAPLIADEHAFYYQPDDPTSLGRTINSALADKDRLKKMATLARAHVIANHSWPHPLADIIVRPGLVPEPLNSGRHSAGP
jgi:hypothetical protein